MLLIASKSSVYTFGISTFMTHSNVIMKSYLMENIHSTKEWFKNWLKR